MEPVLVVVHDTDLRHMLPRLLRAEGYHVVVAFSVREAFELVQSFTPAAIVLDIVLPQVSGWTFVRQAQQMPDVRSVPILALTARPDEERGPLYALGCAACLGKPIQIGSFLEQVRQLTGKQRCVGECS